MNWGNHTKMSHCDELWKWTCLCSQQFRASHKGKNKDKLQLFVLNEAACQKGLLLFWKIFSICSWAINLVGFALHIYIYICMLFFVFFFFFLLCGCWWRQIRFMDSIVVIWSELHE